MKRFAGWFLTLAAFGALVGCVQVPDAAEAPEMDIYQASFEGNTEVVQAHIDAGTPLELPDPFGSTAIGAAAFQGQDEVIEMLIAEGVDIDVKTNDGSTPLAIAAFMAHPSTVRLLLEAGADPHPKDNSGSTPLDLASAEWSSDIEGIYNYIGSALDTEIDLERVQASRGEVADILREYPVVD